MIADHAINPASDFGALGDGRTDDTAALQRAFDAAASSGRAVRIPAGVYLHGEPLELRGITVTGDGDRTVLTATDSQQGALHVTGAGAVLEAIRLGGTATRRFTNNESAGVHVENARDFRIERVTIDNAGSAGILVRTSGDGRILDNRISGTKADAIHLTDGSHDILVRGNRVDNAGDDGVACVSYIGPYPKVRDVTVEGNTVTNNAWGRNFSVVGGESIRIVNNTADGNRAGGAGVYIAGEPEWRTRGATDVLVAGNTIRNTGGPRSGHGEVMIYNATTEPSDRITIADNTILSAPYQAITVTGPGNRGVTITGNTIKGVAAEGIAILRGGASVTVTGNRIADVAQDGVGIARGAPSVVLENNRMEGIDGAAVAANRLSGGSLIVKDNQFIDVARSATQAGGVINLSDARLDRLSVTGNRQSGRSPRLARYFLYDDGAAGSVAYFGNRTPLEAWFANALQRDQKPPTEVE